MVMKNVHVRDFLQKLSGEKLYADWTDVDNTKQIQCIMVYMMCAILRLVHL